MTNTMNVVARDLQVGDFIIGDEVTVDYMSVDGDGVWLEFSDGDAGYSEPWSPFTIEARDL